MSSSPPGIEVNIKNKQKNMLARASPAGLHLKAAREQQLLNGLGTPPEDGHQHPDTPTPSRDNCDSSSGGSSEEGPADRNNTEHCQHEGPFSKNGTHSPRGSSSMNGGPGFTRTEPDRSRGGGGGGGEEEAGPGPAGPQKLQMPQPPTEELARLDLGQESHHGSIRYVRYESELQMPWIMRLITKDLSEPYSIYTYRYFIHNWPQLCFLVSTNHLDEMFHLLKTQLSLGGSVLKWPLRC